MIPLGSCTMKLNATTEMEPVGLPGFADIHPFAPLESTPGYLSLIDELEGVVGPITGYAKVSVQPNAGSQGELAGLLAIAAYHRSQRCSHERNVCLIPSSAHGTNAASAVMAGMRVVVVASLQDGTVDLEDLRREVRGAQRATGGHHGDVPLDARRVRGGHHRNVRHGPPARWAGLHRRRQPQCAPGAGQPGVFGGDVSHLNLHKTFCIPHGGGGPGVGPVAVAEHLVPFLPSHPCTPVRRNARASARSVPLPSGAPGSFPSVGPTYACWPPRVWCTPPSRPFWPPTTWPLDSPPPTRSSTRVMEGWWRTNASSTCGVDQGDRGHGRRRGQATDRLRLSRPHRELSRWRAR
jgi:glycine dehydrogenase